MTRHAVVVWRLSGRPQLDRNASIACRDLFEFSRRGDYNASMPKFWLPWVCLAVTLILYLVYLRHLRPERWFGASHDDAVYFSSAKALAQGRGYIIPGLPGSPPETKEPVLYPWLLSWVWRCRPSFPANIVPAAWMTAFFGCWFLVAAFQLLRKLTGVGDWPALVMVTLCAFQPHFLLFSRCLMSDVPFMALAFTAALAGDVAARATGRLGWAAITGTLVGLSVMTRSVGVAVMAGILAAALCRRAYRQAAAICLGSAPFVFALLWARRTSLAVAQRGGLNTLPGWQQTFFFYTSYVKFWRLSVPSFRVFLQMLGGNVRALAEGPSIYFLEPTLRIGNSLIGNALGGIVWVGVVAGIVRQARRQEWKPIHFIFVFYSAVILSWPYATPDRFLLLFLPLFCAGLWLEGKRAVRMLLAGLRDGCHAGERVLAAVMLTGVAILAGIAAWNYGHGYRPQLSAEQRASLMPDKAEAYQWIRQNTDPEARVVAYEDPSLYLYTGHQAVPLIILSAEYAYTREGKVLERDLAHITDAALAVGARYWLTSEDDFHLELEDARARMKKRVADLLSPLPEVYHSRDGRVRLYDISCLLQPEQKECQGWVPTFVPPH
ncbi:MAG: ArnT family glycosyltransferase [Terriglobia bacterium]